MCDFHRWNRGKNIIYIYATGARMSMKKKKVKMTHTCFSLLVSLSRSYQGKEQKRKIEYFSSFTLYIWWRRTRVVGKILYILSFKKKEYRRRGKEQIHRCYINSSLSGINIRSWPYGKGMKIRNIFSRIPHGKHLVLIAISTCLCSSS